MWGFKLLACAAGFGAHAAYAPDSRFGAESPMLQVHLTNTSNIPFYI